MKVLVYDIETLKELFLITIYLPEEDKYYEFRIDRWTNQFDGFMRFSEKHSEYYWTGYNNLRFDSQVIEWILKNQENWNENSALEICSLISQKASDVIHDSNFDIFPEYREESLSFKQIDLFTLNHFNNKNRMVSLKRLEFEMDLENIEEMPIVHDKNNLSKEEIEMIRQYCKNDVYATYEFYKMTIGETSHPLYKENNQIQLRQDIESEFGIQCLNFSDSKIGDEMIKKYYCQEKNIKYNELPKKGLFRKEIAIKNCIAKYIEFQSPILKTFLKKIRKLVLKMTDEFKEQIVFYNNTYSFMKGGLHTENKPKIFTADDEHLIIDLDVSSYYPAIIINNGRYPAHLGKEFLRGYKQMFDKRLELKPLAKNDAKIKGIVGALKLAVNSVYGKSSDMQSWMYDRELTMFTTITGELSLMMLIEACELQGINVISANTDGVTCKIHKDKLNILLSITKWWEAITTYSLERVDYQKIIFSTVNDYIAIKTDGEVKKKGDFLTDFELHKNHSGRIIPLALEQYYINNVPVEQTIKSCNNIYDFVLRQKASKDFHYEGIDKNTGQKTIYNKLIRYYISNTGEKLLKVKNPSCQTNAVQISQVEAGEWKAIVCNHLPKDHSLENINYSYYIERAERIINKIQLEGKRRKIIINPLQINMFEL